MTRRTAFPSSRVNEIIQPSVRLLPRAPPPLALVAPYKMRWNIVSIRLMSPPPPALGEAVASMLRHGEKPDLALGGGMFLLRLW